MKWTVSGMAVLLAGCGSIPGVPMTNTTMAEVREACPGFTDSQINTGISANRVDYQLGWSYAQRIEFDRDTCDAVLIGTPYEDDPVALGACYTCYYAITNYVYGY